jgi:mono/diheme cytochrome c family protein
VTRALPLLAVLAVLAVLPTSGCDLFSPEVGAPLLARCADEDSDPGRAVSFRGDLAPLFQTRCAGCHTAGGAAPIGLEIGGLDLASYSTLRAGGAVSGARVVVPGQPCASALVQKLGPAPPFGARMPLSGPPFLDDADLQLVHDWIAEGARED